MALFVTSFLNNNIIFNFQKEKELMGLCSKDFLDEADFKRFRELSTDETINLNCTDNLGRTPLLLLAKSNQSMGLYDCLQILLQQNQLNINAKDGDWNALMYVCRYYSGVNLFYIVTRLLDCGSELVKTNALLILCINYKHEIGLFRIIKLFLSHGVDISTTDDQNGFNALFALCFYYTGSNLIAIIRMLLKAKIDVNSTNKHGWNSLLALADRQMNHPDFYAIVELLIRHGIDVNVQDCRGVNFLITICEHYKGEQFLEIVRLLVDQKIAVNAMTSLEGNALYYLCYNGNSLVEVMRLLLDAGMDVNKKTNENWSSLLALSSEQANHPEFIDAVKLLIEKRVELNATDDRRRNAFIILCSKFN